MFKVNIVSYINEKYWVSPDTSVLFFYSLYRKLLSIVSLRMYTIIINITVVAMNVIAFFVGLVPFSE